MFPFDLNWSNSSSGLQDELGFIDLLINNAALERMERFCDSDWDQTAMDLAVNVRGPMDLTRLILPGMIERDCGHIVNVASLAGLVPMPTPNPM